MNYETKSLPVLLGILVLSLAALVGLGWLYWESARHLSLAVWLTAYVGTSLGFEFAKRAYLRYRRYRSFYAITRKIIDKELGR